MYDDTSWRSRASCRGENAVYFFAPSHFERKPEKDLREDMARSLCRSCVVRQECLDYSIEVEGLARRHDRPVVPTLTGILWVCAFHSGIPMEEWSR